MFTATPESICTFLRWAAEWVLANGVVPSEVDLRSPSPVSGRPSIRVTEDDFRRLFAGQEVRRVRSFWDAYDLLSIEVENYTGQDYTVYAMARVSPIERGAPEQIVLDAEPVAPKADPDADVPF
jgi:hypothetical protein